MSRSHAALLVDTDPKGLESLAYGFQGSGWKVTTCPSPETAAQILAASDANIVVLTSREPTERTLAFLGELHGKEVSRALPILVLGSADLRRQLRNHDNVKLLPVPAYVRDVLTASSVLVATNAAAAHSPREEPCFASPLTHLGTLSLLRTMNGLALSGLLQLEHAGRQGEVWFHHGDVTAAQLAGLQGAAAVHHLLLWETGTLVLRLRTVAKRGQLRQTPRQLLDEAERFQRDFAHAIKDIGPTSSIYTKNAARLSQSAGDVPPEVSPVVRLCDGKRTLADILDESPFHMLDTVRVVTRLIEIGVFDRREPKPKAAPDTESTALDDFLQTVHVGGAPNAESPPHDTLKTESDTSPPHGVVAASRPTTGSNVLESDRRDSTGSRRKRSRRGKSPTLDFGVPVPGTPSNSPAPAGPELAAVAHAPDGSAVPRIEAPAVASASGTIDLRKGDRRISAARPTARVRPSIIVNTELSEVAEIIDRDKLMPQAQGKAIVLAPYPAAPVQLPPVDAEIAAPTADEDRSARITGVLQVAPSGRSVRPDPAMRTARISIQVDASLAPSQDASPLSGTKLPDKASVRQSKQEPNAPTENHRAGVIHVPDADKASRTAPPARAKSISSSFHIDPSLTDVRPLPTASAHNIARRITPVQTALNRTTTPHPIPPAPTHPSGSFSAIESDFFAREADLFKEETTESFADLDGTHDKDHPRQGQRKKPRP